MGVMRFVYMAKAAVRFRSLTVSIAESAVCAPLHLRRHVFLHCVRELSEARSALALRPEHVAVLRMLRITGERGCTNG